MIYNEDDLMCFGSSMYRNRNFAFDAEAFRTMKSEGIKLDAFLIGNSSNDKTKSEVLLFDDLPLEVQEKIKHVAKLLYLDIDMVTLLFLAWVVSPRERDELMDCLELAQDIYCEVEDSEQCPYHIKNTDGLEDICRDENGVWKVATDKRHKATPDAHKRPQTHTTEE